MPVLFLSSMFSYWWTSDEYPVQRRPPVALTAWPLSRHTDTPSGSRYSRWRLAPTSPLCSSKAVVLFVLFVLFVLIVLQLPELK